MNLCYLRHCWVGLIDWCVIYLMVSINRFEEVTWFDFFTYWSDLCIHDNLVQQIDLFLHISLGRVSSSFLLDLHSKCLNGLIRYFTSIFWSTSIIVQSYSLSTPSSIGIYMVIQVSYIIPAIYVQLTNLHAITTSTLSSSSSSIMNYSIINNRFDHYYHFCCCCW